MRGSKQFRFPVKPHSSIYDFTSSQDGKEKDFLLQEPRLPLSSCPLASLQLVQLLSDQWRGFAPMGGPGFLHNGTTDVTTNQLFSSWEQCLGYAEGHNYTLTAFSRVCAK